MPIIKQFHFQYLEINICFLADNRKILHEQEAEKMMILLLGHENPRVQIASAQALGVMSENLMSRESIGQWGELRVFIYLC